MRLSFHRNCLLSLNLKIARSILARDKSLLCTIPPANLLDTPEWSGCCACFAEVVNICGTGTALLNQNCQRRQKQHIRRNMYPSAILLACIISYASSAAQTITQDDPNFAGTQSLLILLGTKEEVIRMLLSKFQQELREKTTKETTRHASSFSCDGTVDLVDR